MTDEQVQDDEGAVSKTTVFTRAPKAVSSGKKPEGWIIELEHGLPEDLDGLVEKLTETVVYQLACAQYIIGFQNAVRSLAKAGKTDEEIRNVMSTWKPGERLGLGGDPIQRTLANFGNLNKEQQAELMAKLASMQQV